MDLKYKYLAYLIAFKSDILFRIAYFLRLNILGYGLLQIRP